MDPADLLDYALGRLEGPRRERLERRLARDPALAGRVARLIRNLNQLLDDGRAPCGREGVPSPQSPPAPPTREGSPPRARSEGGSDRPKSDLR